MTDRKGLVPPEWRRECEACAGEGRIEHPAMPLHHLHSEAPEYAVVDCEECGGTGWNWTDEPVTLAECRPGPFWFNGSLGFKTEYGMALPNGMGMWTVTNWPEAYCMDSGECFWGGTSKHEDRAKLLVWPVEELTLALHRADALTEALRVVRELEAANNALCAKRSDATYDSMILGDGAKDELEALDEARRRARAFLAQHEGEER